MDYYEKRKLAQDEKTNPEVLEELSRDEDWKIRFWVASNSSTSEGVLIRLSRDRDWGIRSNVIRNANLGGILKEIARVRLAGERKVNWDEFGYLKLKNRVNLWFLRIWEARYVHGL